MKNREKIEAGPEPEAEPAGRNSHNPWCSKGVGPVEDCHICTKPEAGPVSSEELRRWDQSPLAATVLSGQPVVRRLIAEVKRLREITDHVQVDNADYEAANKQLSARIAELEADKLFAVGQFETLKLKLSQNRVELRDARARIVDLDEARSLYVETEEKISRALADEPTRIAELRQQVCEANNERDEAFRQNEASVVAYRKLRARIAELEAEVERLRVKDRIVCEDRHAMMDEIRGLQARIAELEAEVDALCDELRNGRSRIALAAAEWREHGCDGLQNINGLLDAILRGEGPERFPPAE